MKMNIKKIFAFIFAFIIMSTIYAISINNVNADTVLTTSDINIIGASVRTEGEHPGLKFVGKFKETSADYNINNCTKIGVLLAFGETTANNSFVKGSIINEYNTLFAEVDISSLEENEFNIALYNIKEEWYIQDFTARAYIICNGNEIYSNEVAVRDLISVSLNAANDGYRENDNLIDTVISYVENNYKYEYFSPSKNLLLTNSIYENDLSKLEEIFVSDWNEFVGEEDSILSMSSNSKASTQTLSYKYKLGADFYYSAKYSKWADLASGEAGVSNISTSNIYKFFNDEEMGAKWMWLLDLLSGYNSSHAKYQINAIKADGTYTYSTDKTALYSGQHICLSLIGFFAKQKVTYYYDGIDFSNSSKAVAYDNIPNFNNKIYANNNAYDGKKIGENYTLPFESPFYNGYNVTSWKLNSTIYNSGNTYLVTNYDVTFKVDSTSPINYTITYKDGNNIINTLSPVSYNIETSTFNLPNPSKNDFSFEGWYSDSEFINKVTSIELGTTGNKIFYAKWRQIDQNAIANTQSYLNDYFDEISKIESNLTLPTYYQGASIEWNSDNTNVLSNDGILKRDYEECQVTLSYTITCGTEEETGTYTKNVSGYTSLNDTIAAGYVYNNYNTIDDTLTDTLDVIYCAFATFNNDGTFKANTTVLNNVNNYLKADANEKGKYMVISLGGGDETQRQAFSTICASSTLRATFVNNIVAFVENNGFDGVDIDWETPTESEKTNFSTFVQELHTALSASNSHYLLTTAVGSSRYKNDSFDLANCKQYFDYINLMTYDMGSQCGYYHNALYDDSVNKQPYNEFNNYKKVSSTSTNNGMGKTGYDLSTKHSIYDSVEGYHNLGVAYSKIIIGMSFYGYKQVSAYDSSRDATYFQKDSTLSYNTIKSSYLNNSNYVYHFDSVCKVPYLLSTDGKTFISFDDVTSISAKCNYAIDNNLGGVMYWQNGQDTSDFELLKTIKNVFNSK